MKSGSYARRLSGRLCRRLCRRLYKASTAWTWLVALSVVVNGGAVRAGAATSEPLIEEIVVTAEFRDASVHRTPSSVSVVAIAERAEGTVQHLDQTLGWIPNVNFSSGGSRARFLQIRGIGERGQFAEPLNASVGLLLDGIDFSGVGTVATLFDASQVEVLRGPQGTLYGANALAGLINVTTPDPTDSFSGYVQLDGGDYGALGTGAVISGPVSSNVGMRLAVNRYHDDGFIKNRHLERDDTGERDEFMARTKWVVDSDRGDRSVFHAGFVDVDNGYDAFSLNNDRTTLSDEPGRDEQRSWYAGFGGDYALGTGQRFEARIGYSDSDSDYGYDEDWTFVGFHPFGYSSTDRYTRQRTNLTVDLRLVSVDNPAFDWVAGVFHLRQSVDLVRRYTFLTAPFASDYSVDRYAAYAEVTRPLTPRLRTTLGLRYERHESDYDDSLGVDFSPGDDMVGGRLTAEYDLGDRAMAYAALSRGYKAGGFNTSGTLPVERRVFEPEKLWNAEIGYKARLFDGRLDVTTSLFWMLRRAVQVNTSVVLVRDDGSAEFIDFTDNAARGFNRGAEVELAWYVKPWLSVFANVGLLETEYEDFVNGAGENLDGRRQAQAPAYQFYGGWDLMPNDRWTLRIGLEGRGDYYLSDAHAERAPSYELLNASLNYRGRGWDARLWARNVTDEKYVVRGFFFGNDPRDLYTPRGFNQLGEPSRVGFTFTARW